MQETLHKIVIVFIIVFFSFSHLNAFDNKDGYEIQVNLLGGFDPHLNTNKVDVSGVFTGAYLLTIALPLSEDYLLTSSYGLKTHEFKIFETLFVHIGEFQVVKDRYNHRYGIGVSYHFNAFSYDTFSFNTSQLDNTLGYVLSYSYFMKKGERSMKTNELDFAGYLFDRIFTFIDLDGFLWGIKYEGIIYDDTVSIKRYSGSSISLNFGFVF